ncbi:hypothetical protein TERTU_1826 [Teredinibacter turnerae T7901]|uniref:Uncharacterized protein n=1 Tax=Teredinibacter turnerae (strain ATCC 39867 / T7901) TaxID=377629 RepID=C5BHT8_TERTT|nr:hypothetical protein TERTU_1826 [Teredinibacter turnerae T7901]
MSGAIKVHLWVWVHRFYIGVDEWRAGVQAMRVSYVRA